MRVFCLLDCVRLCIFFMCESACLFDLLCVLLFVCLLVRLLVCVFVYDCLCVITCLFVWSCGCLFVSLDLSVCLFVSLFA